MAMDTFDNLASCNDIADGLTRLAEHAMKASENAESRKILVGGLRRLMEDGNLMTPRGLCEIRAMIADWDASYVGRYTR